MMTTATQIRRWGEIGIAIVSLLSAIIMFLIGGFLFFIFFALQTNPTLHSGLPNDPVVLAANMQSAAVTGIAYIAIGILFLVVAGLVVSRKRIGLVLAVIAYSIGLIWSINNFVAYQSDLFINLSIPVELAMIVASISILLTSRRKASSQKFVSS